MRQIAAIFLDSYRELNSRRLFWVILAISLVFVVVLASIGFDDKGMFIFFGLKHFESELLTAGSPMAKLLYRGIFATFIVPIWLGWIAAILALVSTAPVFPEFVAGGAIDLMLCKPISRLKLFLCKYAASLLFVILQVTVFCIGVFLAMGWRIGDWEWRVFAAIPIITLFYSYLYSFCVWVGVWTRSTLAALLMTMILWVGTFAVASTEAIVMTVRSTMAVRSERAPEDRATQLRQSIQTLDRWLAGVRAARWPLPKTSETKDLLDRMLSREGDINLMDLIQGRVMLGADGEPIKVGPRHEEEEAQDRLIEESYRLSPAFIIGTSLLFEFGMLGLAGWIFCRRDF
jgi:ABC-type transport system involved in multi-copper enzyme maturation permease subunit